MTADPISGDPGGVRRVARVHQEHAEAVRAGVVAVHSAVDDAHGAWHGSAQRAFLASAAEVPPAGSRIIERLEAAAQALHTYATEVEQIQDEARRLTLAQQNAADDAEAHRRAISRLRSAAGSGAVAEADLVRLARLQNDAEVVAALQARLSAQWADLVVRRAAADRRAASALDAPTVIGALAAARTVSTMSDERFLSYLASLGREDIAALKRDTSVARRLAAVHDADMVASWWNGLSGGDGVNSAAQRALIAAFPAVVGNLNGVAYWARAQANERVLPQQLENARQQVERWQKRLLAATSDEGRRYAQDHLDDWTERRDGYERIADVIRTGSVSLIAVTDDHPPLAQIVSGNLDSAKHVTYIVPGMGTATNQGGTLTSYAAAARGLRDEQHQVAGVDRSDVAVVAWIGYHPPMADDWTSASVLTNGRAQTGGAALAADLQGFDASRQASGTSADVSVVGHSYGTNVVTIALTKTHVDHAVLLGSAGVSAAVPDAAAMHVPKGEVYASQGAHDAWAITGQNLSGRQDPTSPSFGAHSFSSETTTVEGETLHGVTNHGPFDGRNTDERYSYFDNGTTAQYNTARATMGDGASIPDCGRPFDRERQNVKDGNWLMYDWQTGLSGVANG